MAFRATLSYRKINLVLEEFFKLYEIDHNSIVKHGMCDLISGLSSFEIPPEDDEHSLIF